MPLFQLILSLQAARHCMLIDFYVVALISGNQLSASNFQVLTLAAICFSVAQTSINSLL